MKALLKNKYLTILDEIDKEHQKIGFVKRLGL